MTLDSTVAVIAFLVMVISALIGVSGYIRGLKQEALEEGSIRAMLTGIGQGVEEIKLEQRAVRKSMGEISNRVAALESENRSVHKRIDRLE